MGLGLAVGLGLVLGLGLGVALGLGLRFGFGLGLVADPVTLLGARCDLGCGESRRDEISAVAHRARAE